MANNVNPDQIASMAYTTYYSFLAWGDFCHLLITFANSLNPDQGQHNVDPGLDPYCLTL